MRERQKDGRHRSRKVNSALKSQNSIFLYLQRMREQNSLIFLHHKIARRSSFQYLTTPQNQLDIFRNGKCSFSNLLKKKTFFRKSVFILWVIDFAYLIYELLLRQTSFISPSRVDARRRHRDYRSCSNCIFYFLHCRALLQAQKNFIMALRSPAADSCVYRVLLYLLG